tara:strand:- start:78217 stop:78375 length:159 start_codon:yes stop_codon:yes gene_type:complete
VKEAIPIDNPNIFIKEYNLFLSRYRVAIFKKSVYMVSSNYLALSFRAIQVLE